jgi:hypothetical protein
MSLEDALLENNALLKAQLVANTAHAESLRSFTDAANRLSELMGRMLEKATNVKAGAVLERAADKVHGIVDSLAKTAEPELPKVAATAAPAADEKRGRGRPPKQTALPLAEAKPEPKAEAPAPVAPADDADEDVMPEAEFKAIVRTFARSPKIPAAKRDGIIEQLQGEFGKLVEVEPAERAKVVWAIGKAERNEPINFDEYDEEQQLKANAADADEFVDI